MRHLSLLAALLCCISCAVVNTGHFDTPIIRPEPARQLTNDRLEKNILSNQNVFGNNYRINVGPQQVLIEASYSEKRQPSPDVQSNLLSGDLQRYFDIRAKTGLTGTNVVGEGEMAYGLHNSFDGNLRPGLLGFGLMNRWGDLSYGADYKSIAKGFVSVQGVTADQARDQAVIWGERRIGLFSLRGTLTQLWESLDNETNLRVSRTGAAEIRFNRAQWAGSFSASYGLIGNGPKSIDENRVIINTLATSYRLIDGLLFEPNFSYKEEIQETGARIQAPTSRLSFRFAPLQNNFSLTGGTSFSRVMSTDALQAARIHGTSASMDWRIGTFFGKDDRLSFSFNYDRYLDLGSRINSHENLSSMLQFKVTGF